MKFTLEGREFNVKANGRFMQTYQKTFGKNLMVSLYELSQKKDMLACAELFYCAIDEEKPQFDEWLDSFESPVFILGIMDKFFEYITRSIEPTIASTGNEKTEKKTTK